MSLYRNQLEDWLKKIHVKAERVVDVGGASNPVEKRVASWKVDEYVFLDLAKEIALVDYIKFDINVLLNNQFKDCSREDIEKTLWFDVLFCLEVFEYVWDPVTAFQNIWDLMSNDSIAYISFPAIYPVHNPIEIDYLRYTKNAIQKYLKIVGFTHIWITPRVATKGKQSLSAFYSLEGMHPVRHSELPFDIGYMVKCRKLIT